MRFLSAALIAFCAISALVPPADAADDGIAVKPLTYGSVGQTVEVPVFVNDVSESPVGLDKEKPIQFLQFTVKFSKPELITGCTNQTFPACEVTFRPAGLLAPPFVNAVDPVTFVDGQSIFIRRVSANALDWTLDAPAPGDPIGFLRINIDPDAAVGSELELTFDPAADATKLGDRELTVTETIGAGLKSTGGRLIVVDCSLPPDAAKIDFDWDGVVTDCTKLSSGCRSGEAVVFTVTSPDITFGGCESVVWHFGDGTGQVGNPVVHTYSADTYKVEAFINTDGGSVTLEHTITVSPPCLLPPIAMVDFSYDGQASRCSGMLGDCAIAEDIRFTVIGDDAIASCLAATWDFGDGTSIVSGNPVVHAYTAAGVYTVVAHIGTEGGESVRSKVVTVKEQIACTAIVPTAPPLNTPVLFQAMSDVAGSTFAWFFEDSSAFTQDVEKIYTTSGTKSWSLVVSHDGFSPCQKSGTIEVEPPSRRRGSRH